MMGFSDDISSGAFDGSEVGGAIFGFHGDGSEVDLVVRYRDDSGATTNATLLNGVTGDTTYFIVVKLEYDVEAGGIDRLTAWLNPTAASEGGATAAFTTTGKMLTTNNQITHGGFWIENFYSHYTHYLQFDEMRFGRTWSDALPGDLRLYIQYDSGVLSIDAVNLQPNASNILQSITSLTGGGSWSNLHLSTGATTSTNWVIDPLSDSESFYRVIIVY